MSDKITIQAVFQCGNCGREEQGTIGYTGAVMFGPVEIPQGWFAKTIVEPIPHLVVRCDKCGYVQGEELR